MNGPLIKGIDFHCHLDLYPNWEKMIETCDKAGIKTLAVTTTPRAFSRNLLLTKNSKHVRAALGLHPQLADKLKAEVRLFDELLHQTKYVGEVGLDAGPLYYKTLDDQLEVFIHILQSCARAGNKILSIHSVRAASRVIDLTEQLIPSGKGKIVLHWFTGTLSEARRAVELGYYFSINSVMLDKSSSIKIIQELPNELLLTETDGPFVKTRNGPVRPQDVTATTSKLAELKGLSPEQMRLRLVQNLRCITAE